MDVFFKLNGITFVWNEEKARTNPQKHDGVTFEQAIQAFFDPMLAVVDASRNTISKQLGYSLSPQTPL
jgi:hypothetical protein